MYSYEFIARDRAGLLFTGNNEGTGEWEGTPEQWGEAAFQEDFFLNEGYWYNVNIF